MEIPKEKNAKHSTVSGRNGKLCGPKWEWGVDIVKNWLSRENELGAMAF